MRGTIGKGNKGSNIDVTINWKARISVNDQRNDGKHEVQYLQSTVSDYI